MRAASTNRTARGVLSRTPEGEPHLVQLENCVDDATMMESPCEGAEKTPWGKIVSRS